MLGGLPLPPSALGSASTQSAATFKLAAANLKLYLECVALCYARHFLPDGSTAVTRYTGAALEPRSRERLQTVFTTVLGPHTGSEPDMASIWPLVEPTVVPVRRLEVLERNKRYAWLRCRFLPSR